MWMYHVTPSCNVSSILDHGLTAPRNYLCKSIGRAVDIARQMMEERGEQQYALLECWIENVALFNDPETDYDAVYCNQPIRASRIATMFYID